MEYTQYFARALTAYGAPNLSTEGFRFYMNIVALEGKIAGMEKCKKLNQANPGHIEFEINSIKRQINFMTGNRTPEEELKAIFELH